MRGWRLRSWVSVVCAALLAACGGTAAMSALEPARHPQDVSLATSTDAVAPQMSAASSGGGEAPAAERYDFDDDLVSGDLVRPDGEMLSTHGKAKQEYAEVDAAPAPAPNPVGPGADGTYQASPAVQLSDGRPGQLLVYEAELHMAVYKVEEIERQAIALATQLGGFLAVHDDQERIVVRVPVAKFQDALTGIEALGEIVHRRLKADDVTDQFRDLGLRLRNAEAMRDRLLQLLEKATDVKQSLEVERELDRLSERIELLRGQLKSLGDRIAFSTITIHFRAKQVESLSREFQLPFAWLQQLGLQKLLTLP